MVERTRMVVTRTRSTADKTSYQPRTYCISYSKNPAEQSWIHKYSSFEKLVRVIAFCLRFQTNLAKSKHITIAEFQYNSKAILKFVQRAQYGNEIKDVQNGQQVKKTSTLRHLDPFLHNDGLLRGKGRLEN